MTAVEKKPMWTSDGENVEVSLGDSGFEINISRGWGDRAEGTSESDSERLPLPPWLQSDDHLKAQAPATPTAAPSQASNSKEASPKSGRDPSPPKRRQRRRASTTDSPKGHHRHLSSGDPKGHKRAPSGERWRRGHQRAVSTSAIIETDDWKDESDSMMVEEDRQGHRRTRSASHNVHKLEASQDNNPEPPGHRRQKSGERETFTKGHQRRMSNNSGGGKGHQRNRSRGGRGSQELRRSGSVDKRKSQELRAQRAKGHQRRASRSQSREPVEPLPPPAGPTDNVQKQNRTQETQGLQSFSQPSAFAALEDEESSDSSEDVAPPPSPPENSDSGPARRVVKTSLGAVTDVSESDWTESEDERTHYNPTISTFNRQETTPAPQPASPVFPMLGFLIAIIVAYLYLFLREETLEVLGLS